MFGRNENDNLQDNSVVASTPIVDPTAPTDAGPPAIPTPDQMISPQNPISDPVAFSAPAPDPAVVAPTEPTMPDPVPPTPEAETPQEEAPEENTVNGVAVDAAYTVPALPEITSNYSSKPDATSLDPPVEDELIEIKKKALESLAPLVDELDQTPEEKFKTTMMLIQASDNADLVKDAFAAANAISDEKARAQALLDVVNEINYFTHPHDVPADAEPVV